MLANSPSDEGEGEGPDRRSDSADIALVDVDFGSDGVGNRAAGSTTAGGGGDEGDESTRRRTAAPEAGNDASCLCLTMKGPPWVRNIIACELCERFGYYGLRAVLVLYLTKGLGYSEPTSIAIFSYASAAAYLMSLAGGYVSDTYLGKYKTILYTSAIYCCGCLMLATSTLWLWRAGAFLSLFCIAVGTGGIKPCVATFGADQFAAGENRDEASVRSYFMAFYFAINVGALASFIVTPVVRHFFGYFLAFFVPFVLLGCAVLALWSARKKYHNVPPAGSPLAASLQVVLLGCRTRTRYAAAGKGGLGSGTSERMAPDDEEDDELTGDAQSKATRTFATSAVVDGGAASRGDDGDGHALLRGAAGGGAGIELQSLHTGSSAAGATTAAQGGGGKPRKATTIWDWALRGGADAGTVSDVKALSSVLPIFAVLPVFWMLFDQQGSSWTLQASHMDTLGVEPEQIQMLGTLLVLIFIPILDKLIYPRLWASKWERLHPYATRRMAVGMFITSLSFLCSFFVQLRIVGAPSNSVWVVWLVPQYVLVTLGEVLVSTTGLEFAYQQAPESMKGTVMSLFYATTATGDLLTGVLFNALSSLAIEWIFLIFACLMVVAACIFLVVVIRCPVPRAANKV